ncbi:MAG: hypothetical protein KBI09_12290 [Mesotoga sp.]|nr:hypothetical protein [Mesotoga sp.]
MKNGDCNYPVRNRHTPQLVIPDSITAYTFYALGQSTGLDPLMAAASTRRRSHFQ